jgi:hypothetical protein
VNLLNRIVVYRNQCYGGRIVNLFVDRRGVEHVTVRFEHQAEVSYLRSTLDNCFTIVNQKEVTHV